MYHKLIQILVATLILSCIGPLLASQNKFYEFHDSNGHCWRCLPGKSCVRCPSGILPFNFPDPWDRACPYPSDYCDMFPGAKFPSTNIK